MPRIVILAYCSLFLALQLTFAQQLRLVVTDYVTDGFGGVPFLIQPALKVINLEGETEYDFSGSVAAEIYSETPTTTLLGGDVVEAISSGVAQYDDLFVNKVGLNYQMRFTLRDEFGNVVAFAVGGLFSVKVGVAHQLGIVTQPAIAYGGSPFLQQPVVAIQDRGHNIVSSVNEGTVSSFCLGFSFLLRRHE